MSPRRWLPSALATATLLLVSCSSTVTVDQADLEDQVAEQLSQGGGPADGEVSCPGDLEGTVGATMTCEATSEEPGSVGGARVDLEVTEVDGSDVGFDYEITARIDPAFIEEQVSTELTEQVGQAPDDVECPDVVDATVGAETTCLLTAGEDTIDVMVTIDSVEGSDISLDIQVADEVN